MLKRILLLVEDTPFFPAAATWTLELARALSARIFALCVIPPLTNGNSARRERHLEERAWSLLYEVEDDAFAMNVRISLLLEQGDFLDKTCSISTDYKTSLLVVGADSRISLADLLHQTQYPVVIVKPTKEVQC